MSLKFVILGFISEAPLTGYDLKKKFSESEIVHWSGNNNQVYRTLVELHEEGLVTVEVQYQDSKPPRKIYTITDAGRSALAQWILTPPELPQFRSPLAVQLAWADQVDPQALNEMLGVYEADLLEHLLMLREQMRRNREGLQNRFFADRIANHWLAFYELELNWIHTLRQELSVL